MKDVWISVSTHNDRSTSTKHSRDHHWYPGTHEQHSSKHKGMFWVPEIRLLGQYNRSHLRLDKLPVAGVQVGPGPPYQAHGGGHCGGSKQARLDLFHNVWEIVIRVNMSWTWLATREVWILDNDQPVPSPLIVLELACSPRLPDIADIAGMKLTMRV